MKKQSSLYSSFIIYPFCYNPRPVVDLVTDESLRAARPEDFTFPSRSNSMRQFVTPCLRAFLLIIALAFSGLASYAQQANRPQPSEQTDDVVRIKTELV